MSAQISIEEAIESLTGYDEIAVQKAFGVNGLEDLNAFGSMRALVFVLLKRNEGLVDKDAKERVMNMPLSEVKGYFSDLDEAGVDPVAGELEAGEGDGPDGPGPRS